MSENNSEINYEDIKLLQLDTIKSDNEIFEPDNDIFEPNNDIFEPDNDKIKTNNDKY